MNCKYKLHEWLIKEDGTKTYCIDKLVDEIAGCPVYELVFSGTYEYCKEQLDKLEKETSNEKQIS